MTLITTANAEQLLAHAETARLRNPQFSRIEELHAQLRAITAEIISLTSKEECYVNRLASIALVEEEAAAAARMSGDELIGHLSEMLRYDDDNLMADAIVSEAFARIEEWVGESA